MPRVIPQTVNFLCLACASLAVSQNAQNLSTGGFVSVGYLESSRYNYLADTEGGTYDFIELGLNASWTPANRTTINGQAFLWELGPYGNYEPIIDYLFLDYSHSREFGFQVGRIKREFGLYTHIQDIDLARTCVILPHGIYDPRYRDFSVSLDGVAGYGEFQLRGNQRLSYNLYAGRVKSSTEGGLSGFTLTAVSRITIDNEIELDDTGKNIGGQIWYYPNIDGLRLGYAHTNYEGFSMITRGRFPDFLPDPFLAGQELVNETSNLVYDLDQLSLEYFKGDWNFAAEYHQSEATLNLLRTVGGVPIANGPTDTVYTAWYASLSKRFGSLEVGFTYTEMPNDSGGFDEGNAAYQNDHQVSLRYDVTDNWILKLEVHSIEGTKRLFNQYGQNPVLDRDNWTLWAAKSTFTF